MNTGLISLKAPRHLPNLLLSSLTLEIWVLPATSCTTPLYDCIQFDRPSEVALLPALTV